VVAGSSIAALVATNSGTPGSRRRRAGGILRPTVITLLLLLLLAAVPRPSLATNVADVKARGKLVVLAYPDAHNPFLARKAPGQFEGVDVSILRSFAVALGVPLEVREITSFDDLLPSLLRGDGDIVAGGFSITAERRQRVDYSIPYFPVAIMVIARKDSGIRTVLGISGKRGAAVPGTTHDGLMREMGIVPSHALLRSGLAYEALHANAADFAFVDSTSGMVSLEKFPDLFLVGMLPKADYYAFAMTKGSDLRPVLDRHLAAIRTRGLLYELFKRHLGPSAVALYELFKKSTGGALP
jgi:ABC-type amino acid transport substrate-binding protein